jgi:hypothetical protein
MDEIHLTPAQVHALLSQLCIKQGFCLPPLDQVRLAQDPPTTVDSFTDEVFVSEQMFPPADLSLYRTILASVAKHFEAAAIEIEKRRMLQ